MMNIEKTLHREVRGADLLIVWVRVLENLVISVFIKILTRIHIKGLLTPTRPIAIVKVKILAPR